MVRLEKLEKELHDLKVEWAQVRRNSNEYAPLKPKIEFPKLEDSAK